MKNRHLLAGILIIIVVSLPVLAAEEPVEDQESKMGNIKAGHMKGRQKENIYIFTEDVQLDYKDIKVNADRLKMNRDEDKAYFTGSVHLIRNPNSEKSKEEIWSKELDFDLQTEVLTARKDVELDSTKNNKPLKLTSQYLKIWTKTNNMEAKRDVFVDYNGQKIRGEQLEYTAEKDKMVVTEEVEIKEDNSWMKSERADFWLEDEVLEAEGKVEMEFEVDD